MLTNDHTDRKWGSSNAIDAGGLEPARSRCHVDGFQNSRTVYCSTSRLERPPVFSPTGGDNIICTEKLPYFSHQGYFRRLRKPLDSIGGIHKENEIVIEIEELEGEIAPQRRRCLATSPPDVKGNIRRAPF